MPGIILGLLPGLMLCSLNMIPPPHQTKGIPCLAISDQNEIHNLARRMHLWVTPETCKLGWAGEEGRISVHGKRYGITVGRDESGGPNCLEFDLGNKEIWSIETPIPIVDLLNTTCNANGADIEPGPAAENSASSRRTKL
jgi:hypothetical protein